MNPHAISECLHVNDEGHLCIGGCDTVSLAETYGTPLYVMDQAHIENVCSAYTDILNKDYGFGMIAYASKAFSCKEIYRIVNGLNLGADVVSGGELYTAIQAGFPTETRLKKN